MPQWLQWALIAIGVLAILFLLLFIFRQGRQMRAQRQVEEKSREFRTRRQQDMIESIRIIAMAVEQDQVEYSEACLRIKGLLDHVSPELLEQSPYRVFQTVHDQIEHMPTHRARQQTDRRFVRKMDKERFALEQTYSDEIRRAATAVRHHRFD